VDGRARERIELRRRATSRAARAGLLVHEVLEELSRAAAPGVSTAELDRIALARTRARGAAPAFLGYHGYPASLCVSVNDEVVHGIPSTPSPARGDSWGSTSRGVRLYGDSARTVRSDG